MLWYRSPWNSLKAKLALLTLVTFLLGVWSLAYYASRTLREDMQDQISRRQFSAVSMLAAHVNEDLSERLEAEKLIAEQISPAFLRDPAALQALLERRPVLQRLFNVGTFVTGLDGTAIAEFPRIGRVGVNYMDRDHVAAALREGKATVGQPVIGKKVNAPSFAITTPIRDARGGVIGALVGAIDLGEPNFLDKITQNGYGESGGHFIVDRRHRLIVTATDKSRIMETLPAPGISPASDQAMEGDVPSSVYVNPRGVEVLGSAKGVPVSNWYVGTILPTEEAFAPIDAMQRRILLGSIVLSLLAGALVWLLAWRVLRHQLSPVSSITETLDALSASDQPPQSLPVHGRDEIGELIAGFNRLLEASRHRERALRASEERYRHLVENSPYCIHELDLQGRLTSMNRAGLKMLGAHSESEICGLEYLGLVREPERAAISLLLERGLQGEASEFEFTGVNARSFQSSFIPIVDETGKTQRLMGLTQDVTERDRIIDELRQSEQRFRKLFEDTREPISIIEDGLFVDANRASLDMLRVDRLDQLKGLSPANISPEYQPDGMSSEAKAKAMIRIAFEGGSNEFEWEHLRPNGEHFFADVLLTRMTFGAKQLLHVVWRDITEKKRAEAALQESKAQFQRVVDLSPYAMALVDSDGTIEFINRKAIEVFGYSPHEIPDMDHWWRLAYPDAAYRAEVFKLWTELVIKARTQNEEIESREYRVTCNDRGVKILRIFGVWIGDKVLAIFEDVTERRRMEEVHSQAQKLTSLGTLSAGIAHDFNNILGAIRGFCEIATEEVGPDHVAAESLKRIRQASARATELVRRITAFGGRKEGRRVPAQVGDVVEEVISLLRATLPATISLMTELAKDMPPIMADVGQIHEAVVNLTTNAAYAIGGKAGTIEYRTELLEVDAILAQTIPNLNPGRYARLTVTDSGCGMDAQTMERIFDAFFTTKPIGQGTGLGLSMVYGIMQGHEGAVQVESEPGKGSSFQLFFPIAEVTSQTKQEIRPAQSAVTAGKRVIYVDDEEPLAFLAKRVLSRLGFVVAIFTDPKDALANFRAHPNDYDIVVTDLTMPGMTGFDLARDLLATRPDIPVLVTTGYARDEDEVMAREIGVREIVLKPVTAAELGSAFERAFRLSPRVNS